MNDKEKITQEARKILEEFAKSLKKVKAPIKKKNKSDSFREEGEGDITNKEFRKLFLQNSPNKNEDYLISEKANWA